MIRSRWALLLSAALLASAVLCRSSGAAPLATAQLVSAATPTQAPAAADTTIAVLYFDVHANDEGLRLLRKGLAQMLVTDLSAVEGGRLVERDQVEAVFVEQRLHASGKVDAKTAARVGKLLGARLLVLGSAFALGSALRLDARVVDAETGVVVVTAKATARDDDILAAEGVLASALLVGLKRHLATRRAVAGEKSQEKSAPEARDAAAPRGSSLAKRPSLRRPQKLSRALAERYASALDAKDRGDKAAARAGLESVVREVPDFELAYADLQSLAR